MPRWPTSPPTAPSRRGGLALRSGARRRVPPPRRRPVAGRGPGGDPAWRDAGPQVRAAVCLEIVDAINARGFEIANAVMHTSGQPFVMAFQAGGPHAQDRAVEAIVAGLVEQERVPTR